VQAEFEVVLERLMGRRTAATGAGRTDTGVHALGQGVGFLADGRWADDVAGLYRALNALLPRDIWVERVSPMRPAFHARNSALARRYRYVIGTTTRPARRSGGGTNGPWAAARCRGAPAAADLLLGSTTSAASLRPARLGTAHYRSRVRSPSGRRGLTERG